MTLKDIETGFIALADRDDRVDGMLWHEHSKFPGVYLKHLIRGTQTEGRLSCHLVKINPNAVLEDHVHEDQWELHEVIQGDGKFILEFKETVYYPGGMGLIPANAKHKVIAGQKGLILLAKFFPALL